MKNLNENQWNYLRILRDYHALTIKKLANELNKSQSSVRSTLKGLEKRGLIKFMLSKMDNKTRLYWITKKGEKAFQENRLVYQMREDIP